MKIYIFILPQFLNLQQQQQQQKKGISREMESLKVSMCLVLLNWHIMDISHRPFSVEEREISEVDPVSFITWE